MPISRILSVQPLAYLSVIYSLVVDRIDDMTVVYMTNILKGSSLSIRMKNELNHSTDYMKIIQDESSIK